MYAKYTSAAHIQAQNKRMCVVCGACGIVTNLPDVRELKEIVRHTSCLS